MLKYKHMLNVKQFRLFLGKSNFKAFTIVELLVVIVVIGILAAITVVSYSGITNRARIASLESDLANSSKLLKMFYVDNGVYPDTVSTDCVASPTTITNLCLRPSSGNNFTSITYSRPADHLFGLTATNGALNYYITENSSPVTGVYTTPSLAVIDPINWVAIGTQVWAKYNLNVGTMITGVTEQTNNGGVNIVEKYCYDNLESNCNNYGGLYQWGEAMKYITTPGTQGICPTGSHIPTDAEWKTLEMHLGMTQGQADVTLWRGIDQGAKLMAGGSSGLDIQLFGFRSIGSSFSGLSLKAYLWSSSENSGDGWNRRLDSGNTATYRGSDGNANGFSIRCLEN